MQNKLKFSVAVLLACLLAACASDPLKAPCDHQGHFCGSKTKINQW